MAREPDLSWHDEDSLEHALYRYVHGLMDAAERAAFEQQAAIDARIRARLGAWARAQRTSSYLRMRLIGGTLRPELFLIPQVEGYGALELTQRHATRRYAAGAAHRATPQFLQTVSEDGRVLLTLRAEPNATWLLSARYAAHGRWEPFGNDYVLLQIPAETLAPPQCLLCLILDLDSDITHRRYLAWFVPDPDAPECYVARLRLPDWHSEIGFARLLFGVVDSDAARWLSDAERCASCDAALDTEAQLRWQIWEQAHPRAPTAPEE